MTKKKSGDRQCGPAEFVSHPSVILCRVVAGHEFLISRVGHGGDAQEPNSFFIPLSSYKVGPAFTSKKRHPRDILALSPDRSPKKKNSKRRSNRKKLTRMTAGAHPSSYWGLVWVRMTDFRHPRDRDDHPSDSFTSLEIGG